MHNIQTTVIVGAGHGGSQCAISHRAENYEGEIILIDSDEADLPYHKPPLSKKYLISKEQTAVPLRSASAYEKASVTRIADTVTGIDTAKKGSLFVKRSRYSIHSVSVGCGC